MSLHLHIYCISIYTLVTMVTVLFELGSILIFSDETALKLAV